MTVTSIERGQAVKLSREQLDAERVARRNAAVPEAAWQIATARGLRAVTRKAVAQAIGMSAASVNNACGTMDELRDDVLRRAIEEEHLGILAAGLAARNPIAQAAPDRLKVSALVTLAT